MEVEYVREGAGVYLVLSDVGEPDYRARMILNLNSEHFLPVSLRHINGESRYYYDVRARQSMLHMYTGNTMDAEAVRELLTSLMQTSRLMEEHLLEPSLLLLSPGYVMFRSGSGPQFCCLPATDGNSFRELAEFLIEHVDSTDEEAVELAYGAYDQVLGENYDFSELLKQKEAAVADSDSFISTTLEMRPEEEDGEDQGYYFREEEEDEEDSIPGGSILKLMIACSILIAISGGAYIYIFMHPSLLARMGIRQEDYIVAGALFTGVLACIIISVLQVYLHSRKAADGEDEDTEVTEDGSPVQTDDPGEKERDEWREYSGSAKDDDDNDETVILEMKKDDGEPYLIGFIDNRSIRMDLTKSPFRVGKSKQGNDHILPYAGISRNHAVFEKSVAGWYVSDLNSTNGVSVNCSKLKPGELQALKKGDEVKLGEYSFIFMDGA